MIFQETRDYLKKIGLPTGDLFDMPTSTQRFPDGAAFRIEVPTVNTAEAVAAPSRYRYQEQHRHQPRHRNLRYVPPYPQEIKEYCRLCGQYGAELMLSVGPRATYDTGATVLSEQGVRISYRLRGQEQVMRAVEDIKRGYDLGVPRIPHL